MHASWRAAVVAGIVLISGVATAPAQASVVRQARLGNNVEGATLITNGPYAGQIAVLDGYDVRAVPISGKSKAITTLFNIRGYGWQGFPSGLAYVGREKAFVLVDQSDNDTLVVGRTGAPPQRRAITHLADSPLQLPLLGSESLVYLDSDAAFPDRIARVVFDADFLPFIEILKRDGTVTKDIAVTGLSGDEFYPTGLSYSIDANQFIVGGSTGLYRVGLDGAVISGPTEVPGARDPEGLVVGSGGRVYASGYDEGALVALDANLTRAPDRDRSFAVGVGLTRSTGHFWDPITQSFVMDGLDKDGFALTVASIPTSLDSRTVLFHPEGDQFYDFPSVSLSAGPGSTLATCDTAVPRIIERNRDGSQAHSVDLGGIAALPGLPSEHRCRQLAYLPTLDAYAIRLRPASQVSTIYVVGRGGNLVSSFTTGLDFIGSLSTDVDHPERVFAYGEGSGDTLFEYDALSGNLVLQQTPDTGIMPSFADFIDIPGDGYALYDWNDSEMGIFD